MRDARICCDVNYGRRACSTVLLFPQLAPRVITDHSPEDALGGQIRRAVAVQFLSLAPWSPQQTPQ